MAEHLGVGGEDLTPEVSLVDDLAADSLDVLDLMLAFEEELHVAIPEPVIDQIRTYGELVEAMQATVRARRAKEARREASRAPALVWVEIAPPPSSAHGGIAHGGWLTPYTAETILQNALRAGPGTRVEVGVPSNLSESAVADIADGFACLGARAVDVCVRRDPALPPVGAAA